MLFEAESGICSLRIDCKTVARIEKSEDIKDAYSVWQFKEPFYRFGSEVILFSKEDSI
jgi:hypothetical protein